MQLAITIEIAQIDVTLTEVQRAAQLAVATTYWKRGVAS